MRKIWFVGLLFAAISSALAFGAEPSAIISGDYVEVRTASVFAGACHYNGEVVTTGRDAVMAWDVKSGKWNGTDLSGVRAMAVVSANANLAEAQAARKSEVVIDNTASEAQAAAFLEAIKAHYGATLGTIVKVGRDAVSFEHKGRTYRVEAPDFAEISAKAMPNHECCKMPNLVWYSPLVPVDNRRVGYTTNAAYMGGEVGEPWQRSGENSAFYGSFRL